MKCLVLNKKTVNTIKNGTSKDVLDLAVERLRAKGVEVLIANYPSIKSMEKWSMDGICPTPDGCRVEPDGTCQHGYPSWLLLIGII